MNPAVVLPAGGGFGASTIPRTGGTVEGVGSVLIGTEFVTGSVDAVGDTFVGLPSTLSAGCGITGGDDGALVLVAGVPTGAIATGTVRAGAGCAPAGKGSSGSLSYAS